MAMITGWESKESNLSFSEGEQGGRLEVVGESDRRAARDNPPSKNADWRRALGAEQPVDELAQDGSRASMGTSLSRWLQTIQ